MSAAASANHFRGVAMALAAGTLFSVNGVASKLVLSAGVSSVALVELRSLGAAVCLFAVVAVLRPRTLRTSRSELGFLALFGITGIALVQWFYFIAIARLPVAIALLLEYTAPVLVALWVRFVRREPVRARVWLALVLSLAGLALVTKVWTGVTLDTVGVAAGLAAAVSLAAYYLLGEHGLGQRDTLSLTAWTLGFSALLWSVVRPWWTLPFDVLASQVTLPASVGGGTATVWVIVVGIVLLGTVAPFLLVLAAIGEIGATRVGLVGMVEPVGAGIAAWLIIGEVLDGGQLVGAATVLAGIVLAETARSRTTGDEPAGPLPEGVAP